MEFDEAGAGGNAAEAGLGAVYILKPDQCLRHEISLRCPAIKSLFSPPRRKPGGFEAFADLVPTSACHSGPRFDSKGITSRFSFNIHGLCPNSTSVSLVLQ